MACHVRVSELCDFHEDIAENVEKVDNVKTFIYRALRTDIHKTQLYEKLYSWDVCRIFLDIENIPLKADSFEARQQEAREAMFSIVKDFTEFADFDRTKLTYIITENIASRHGQFSYHVIFNYTKRFEQIGNMIKTFAVQSKNPYAKCVDSNIYTHGRIFRLPFQENSSGIHIPRFTERGEIVKFDPNYLGLLILRCTIQYIDDCLPHHKNYYEASSNSYLPDDSSWCQCIDGKTRNLLDDIVKHNYDPEHMLSNIEENKAAHDRTLVKLAKIRAEIFKAGKSLITEGDDAERRHIEELKELFRKYEAEDAELVALYKSGKELMTMRKISAKDNEDATRNILGLAARE